MEQKTNILLFEDFTKLYGRWSKGEVRKEDKFDSNINELKTVDICPDFPFSFADKDLIVNGKDKFTWIEVESMIGKIEQRGWRLPDYHEIAKLFCDGNQPPKPPSYLSSEWIENEKGILINNNTKTRLIFPTENKYCDSYWANDSKGMITNIYKNARCMEIGEPKFYYNCFIRTNNHEKTDSIKIRLVKDK